GNLIINANNVKISGGAIILAENINNSTGTMSGDFTLNSTGALTISNGAFRGASSLNGVESGALITVNAGSIALGSNGLFYGVENNIANVTINSSSLNLAG
ncbi:unnamed protein product, partial [Chrysoparadoxa australica]